jgi:hypothetical protein
VAEAGYRVSHVLTLGPVNDSAKARFWHFAAIKWVLIERRLSAAKRTRRDHKYMA